MKKLFLVLAALLVLQALSAVDTVMEFSAYKNPEPPTNPGYTITVKNFNDDGISGISHIYDISKKMANSRTLSNAFYITISSNLKDSIEVGLVFGPFVNQTDGTSTVPVTYTFSSPTATAVKGQNYTSSTDNPRNYTFYEYTASFSCSLTTITASATGTTATLTFNPKSTIRKGTSDKSSVDNVSESNWITVDTIPLTNEQTLPGFKTTQETTQVVEATAYFKLSLEDTDYSNLEANTDYIATVGIIITSEQ